MTNMRSATRTLTVQAADRAQWRAWLHHNGEIVREVWLVIQHAASTSPGVRCREAVEEALCFGWIDSTVRRRDAESWYQRFNPRRARSTWRPLNRQLVERLTAQGLMTPAGETVVHQAKRTGTWSILADAQNGVVPSTCGRSSTPSRPRPQGFDAYSRSKKRGILEWIASAKRPETRQRRITRTIEASAPGNDEGRTR